MSLLNLTKKINASLRKRFEMKIKGVISSIRMYVGVSLPCHLGDEVKTMTAL